VIKQKWVSKKTGRRSRLLDIDCFTGTGDRLPSVDASDGRYLAGYFQNEHGEQWVFVGDLQEKTAKFWSGDAGWDESDADVVVITQALGVLQTMILNGPERMWINACLATVGISVRI
jgi:hypothetical protein